MAIRIGTAGWTLTAAVKAKFGDKGTHLERYAQHFNAVEINSSFYRPHRQATYQRWAASVPSDFRFSVKVPKSITHAARLNDTDTLLKKFLDEVSGLGEKLGALLIQLPPSFAFNEQVVSVFGKTLRGLTSLPAVIEPRHKSWFIQSSGQLLQELKLGRVAADPAIVAEAAKTGGATSVAYYRWHGSPDVYYSNYSEEQIAAMHTRLLETTSDAVESWCIFDNTAAGAAIENAWTLTQLESSRSPEC